VTELKMLTSESLSPVFSQTLPLAILIKPLKVKVHSRSFLRVLLYELATDVFTQKLM